jgi:hypothetical protein
LQKAKLDDLEPKLRVRVERMCRGTLGAASRPRSPSGSAAAADATAADESLASVIDAAPALASTRGVKDRRSEVNRLLDERAKAIVAELAAADLELSARNLSLAKKGKGKMHELMGHPALFPALLKARTLRMRYRGDAVFQLPVDIQSAAAFPIPR